MMIGLALLDQIYESPGTSCLTIRVKKMFQDHEEEEEM